MRLKQMSVAAAVALVLLQGCGSDNKPTASTGSTTGTSGTTSSASTAPTSVTAPSGTTVGKFTVNLGSGAPQSTQALTMANSLGAVSADSSGTFTLPLVTGDPQFAAVTDTSGTTVAIGFVSTTTTAIDATATAKALVYFAAGFYNLPSPYRAQMIDDVSSATGFSDVVTAVATAMTQGGIGSATGGATVSAALKTFVTAFYAPGNTSTAAAEVKKARALKAAKMPKSKAVLVNPSTEQSGITVVNDYNGVHFQNDFRRIGKAFFDEVSYKDSNGNTIAKAVTDVIAAAQIPAETGLTNVTGTLVTAVQALGAGTGTDGVYTPTSTDTVPLALEPNSTSTRYQITIVGAGSGGATLTSEQQSAQNLLAAQQLIQDFIAPIICSMVLPATSSAIDSSLNFDGAGGAFTDFIGTFASTVPTVVQQMNQGAVDDAIWTGFNAIIQSNTLQNMLLQDLYNELQETFSTDTAEAALSAGNSLTKVLNFISAGFVAADIVKTAGDISDSSAGDVFTVDVTPNPVTLTPASSTITVAQTVTLTAAVPSASDSGNTFVYSWQTTGDAGTLTDSMGHSGDFDSSQASVTYTAKDDLDTGDDENPNITDSVGVTVYQVVNNTRVEVGSQVAQITVTPVSATVWTSAPWNCSTSGGPYDGEQFQLTFFAQPFPATYTNPYSGVTVPNDQAPASATLMGIIQQNGTGPQGVATSETFLTFTGLMAYAAPQSGSTASTTPVYTISGGTLTESYTGQTTSFDGTTTTYTPYSVTITCTH